MYGLINKVTSAPGRREALAALMLEGLEDMPGCLAYIVAADSQDGDVLWVTEVWDRRESQEASLDIPAVRSAIERAMPWISGFDNIATTRPVGGRNLP